MEEANLGSPPEERTEMPTLYETATRFEQQNKLRPYKGKQEATNLKDGHQSGNVAQMNAAEKKYGLERTKEKDVMKDPKDDGKKDNRLGKDAGAKLIVPPDTMEKSFKEDHVKKVVVQPLDETVKPLINRNEPKVEKKIAVTEYITNPQKKKLLKKVDRAHLEEEENHKEREAWRTKEGSYGRK